MSKNFTLRSVIKVR